jgi:hypothetical protein
MGPPAPGPFMSTRNHGGTRCLIFASTALQRRAAATALRDRSRSCLLPPESREIRKHKGYN